MVILYKFSSRSSPDWNPADTTAPQGDMSQLCTDTGKKYTDTPLPFGSLQAPFQFIPSKGSLEEERGKQRSSGQALTPPQLREESPEISPEDLILQIFTLAVGG
ncbi:hypothetical protein HGM15179_009892 [Zosterops borbonicus]|uniref:Uncharacterized protein n=1 Tax=Zosterops borbonicus TaxID=364589 RepID=A0A8K1GGE1_9PASS|nr:hypothetical protein HGM15179_009892 [Zosterops borbonicus]